MLRISIQDIPEGEEGEPVLLAVINALPQKSIPGPIVDFTCIMQEVNRPMTGLTIADVNKTEKQTFRVLGHNQRHGWKLAVLRIFEAISDTVL